MPRPMDNNTLVDPRWLLRTALVLLACVAGVGGCQRQLVPTPHVMYGDAGRARYEQLPPALQTSDVPLLYVTDRVIDEIGDAGPRYGYGRSRSLAYGELRVSLGADVDWETLVDDSTRARRSRTYPMRLAHVDEKGKFADVIELLEVVDGQFRLKPNARELYRSDAAGFDAMVNERLADAARREVLVFVHGFSNTVEDAAIRMAQAWHLSGRAGVPIVYTWPAGSSGIKAYAYDRESGEFTIVHLKLLLMQLALNPNVEKVHLISHSRGTDVATTALRELHAEIRGATGSSYLSEAIGTDFKDRDTCDVLKLETFIIAASDMDVDVFVQRFFGENLLRAARRVVVYVSGRDEALGLADWLFQSRRRVGAMRLKDFSEQAIELFRAATSLEIVESDVSGVNTHSYLVEHPAALSDLIVVLRDGLRPGDPGRPLERANEAIWRIDDDYLREEDREPAMGWPD